RQLGRFRTYEDRQQQKHRYVEERSPVTYHPGDLVLTCTHLRTSGLSEKLLQKFLGPYTTPPDIPSELQRVTGEGVYRSAPAALFKTFM
ncbi:MAG: hypothetical protein PV344_07210, partial [Anaplasma sp.]|nr:hypothetical protein [Anaplasma sp.]